LRCPLCTFRFGAIDQHRENVFIIFHVADSTPVQPTGLEGRGRGGGRDFCTHKSAVYTGI
jgi:hypothetical protein